jgi:hypothetical protein
MRLLKQALAILGTVVVMAGVVALVAPKAAQGIVATLVQVANTPANPVPTQAVDNPARQPVGLDVQDSIADGQPGAFATFGDANGPYTVPAGKRLVVESISAQFNLPTGQKPTDLLFLTTINGRQAGFTALPIFSSSANGTDFFQVAANFTAYVDPGTQLQVLCDRSSTTGAAACFVLVMGHLENIQ